jgi:heme exporter protein CcmD
VSDDILGKYGLFVGPAYAITVATFLVLAFIVHRRLQRWSRRAQDGDADRPPS